MEYLHYWFNSVVFNKYNEIQYNGLQSWRYRGRLGHLQIVFYLGFFLHYRHGSDIE